MTLTQLKILVAIADAGGFTAAAEELGISQPAVSRAVAQLEREIRAILLTRSRDGVILTEAGYKAVAHAREALRHATLLRAEVAALTDEISGRMCIASLPSTTRMLSGLAREFQRLHPQVELRIVEGTDDEARSWLDAGIADVAVVVDSASPNRGQYLADDELVVVAPEGHWLAERTSIRFSELEGEAFILSTGGCAPLINAAARRDDTRLHPAYEIRETATILAMVEAGFGVSVLPTLSLHGAPHRVAAVSLDPSVRRRLALQTAVPSPAARAFLSLVDGLAAA